MAWTRGQIEAQLATDLDRIKQIGQGSMDDVTWPSSRLNGTLTVWIARRRPRWVPRVVWARLPVRFLGEWREVAEGEVFGPAAEIQILSSGVWRLDDNGEKVRDR